MPAKMTHTIAGMARSYRASRRSPGIAGELGMALGIVLSGRSDVNNEKDMAGED